MGTKDEVRDTNDVEIRHQVIDRVIDAGGEVLTATVDHGAVLLRGRVGMRDDIALVERLLRAVDGVTDVDAQFTVGGEHGLEPDSVRPTKPSKHAKPSHFPGPTRG